MELFKYCRRQDMESLLGRGALKVGTLFGYRIKGQHGEIANDEAEGIIRGAGNLIFCDPSWIQSMMVDSTVRAEGEGASQVRHFANHTIRSANVYAFCTAATYSEAQHRTWLKSERYDACYRINSAKLFFRAISEQLPAADFIFYARAEYIRAGEANHVVEGRFHPALLKRAGGYDDQDEVRGLWKPRAEAIEPHLVDASRAGLYCEPFRVIEA